MGALRDNPHRQGWFFEYPRDACDELLTSAAHHEELVGLYPWCPNAHEAINERAFPGFILIERLDDGTGTGMVFLAITDPEITPEATRRAVCIKIPSLSRTTAPSIQAIDAVNNEIAILRELDSSPMVHGVRPLLLNAGMVDIGLDRPLPYLITEYIAFLTPFQHYSSRAAIPTWIKVARAFHELHTKRIVHGDIYERNIFFTKDGRPVILDFGSARRITWFSLRAERPPAFFPPGCPSLDEIDLPNQRIGCAFDVACLAATFARSSLQLSVEDAPSTTTGALKNLFGICVRNEPEYRPQTAGELAVCLQKLVDKQKVTVRPVTLALWRSLYRRYPTIVWPTITLSILLIISSLFLLLKWQGERQRNAQERVYNQQLLASAEAKEQAMATMFRTMQIMLKSTIALDEAQVPTQTDGKSSRRNIAIELAKIVQDTQVSEAARLSALQLLIDTARGHLEVDGADFADQCLERAESALTRPTRFTGSNRLVYQCLNVQLMALQSATAMRLNSAQSDRAQAFQVAQDAVDAFLAVELSSDSTFEQRRLFLDTGIDVLGNAIYPFQPLQWKDVGKADAAESVFQHSIESFQDRKAHVQHCLSLARINYHYALLFHKSHVPRLLSLRPEVNAVEVRKFIATARAYLRQIPEESSDVVISLKRPMSDLDASLNTLAGLSYIQSAELDRAREELEKALQYRKLQVEERPGSLRALREVISTAWTLSDTFTSAARASAESTELHMQSIPIRQFAVRECRRLYQMSPDRDAKIAYQVTQIRLSFAQIICGQVDDAILGLKSLDEMVSLEDPGTQHTLGDDVYICLAQLCNAYPDEPKYVELMENQAKLLLTRLAEARKKGGALRVINIEAQISNLLNLMKSPRFSAFAEEESWVSIIRACENSP